MTIGVDYTLTFLTHTIAVTRTMELGDTIIAKLYNEDRDSAECPQRKYNGNISLFTPSIQTDDTFKTHATTSRTRWK